MLSISLALKGITSNRGRAFSTLGGVTLAIALVTMANTSFDRGGRGIANMVLDETPVDLVLWRIAEDEELSVDTALSQMSAVNGLSSVEPVGYLGASTGFTMPGAEPYQVIDTVFGVGEGFSLHAHQLGISLNSSSQSFSLGPWEALFSPSAFSKLELWLGREPVPNEIINLTSFSYPEGNEEAWNLTFVGRYDLDSAKCWEALRFIHHPGIIVSLGTSQEMLHKIKEEKVPFTVYGEKSIQIPNTVLYLVQADRAKLVRSADMDEYLATLDLLVDRIQAEFDSDLGHGSPIEPARDLYASDLSEGRTIFFLASLPIILLGVYLGLVAADLSFLSRRRETSLLRCRGMDMGQIQRLALAESMMLGVLGGFVGVLTGSLLADVVALPVPGMRGLQGSAITDLSISSLATGVTLAVGMTLAASAKTVRRLRRVTLLESLRGYSPAFAGHLYNPRLDLVLVLVPLIIYVSILAGPQTGGPGLVAMVAGMLYGVGVALMPITPIMLTFGLVRILTFVSSTPYALLSRLARPATGDLGYLVEADLGSNPRRSASLAVLIALSVAFGTFILVTTASAERQMLQESIFETGSDVMVSLSNVPDPAAIVSKVTEIDGVAQASLVNSYNVDNPNFRLLSIDPGSLGECVKDNPYFTSGVKRSLDLLEENTNACLVQGAASAKEVQDRHGFVSLMSHDANSSVELRVVGHFKNMPGTPTTRTARALVLTSHHSVENFIEPYMTNCLVKLSHEQYLQDVMAKIRSLHPSLTKSGAVRTAQDYMGEDTLFPGVMESVLSFTNVEFVFILLMASMGLGLVTYASSQEKIDQTVRQIARGMSRRQVGAVFFAEGVTIAIAGLLIGSLVGVLTGYLYPVSMAKIEGLTILTSLTIPPLVIPISVLSILILMMGSLAGARKASYIKLEEALRLRG